MSGDFIITENIPTLGELVSLYSEVGWSTYTKDPELLLEAFQNSTLALTARDADGSLCGVARALSDGATICFIQDVVVDPMYQRQGLGAALLSEVLSRYETCRQVFLTTDADGPIDFYRSLGFVPHGDLGLMAMARKNRPI